MSPSVGRSRWQRPRLGRPAAYGVAAVIPIAVAAFQHLAVPHLNVAPFVLLYFGVTVAAWLGGSGPGVLAALISAPLGNYLFIAPHSAFNFDGPSLQASLLFLVTASAIAWLTGSLHTQARRKDEFLTLLSHELRNPLAPIRNSLFILECVSPGSERARRALLILNRQSAHLAKILDNLLDHSRISSGKIRLRREPVDLNVLADQVSDDYRMLFETAGVELEVREDPDDLWVDGDETRLSQALGSLLQNAANFTPRGGRAVLTLTRSDTGEQAVIRLSDDGVGIAPELQRKLFRPFVQGDFSLDHAKGGLGLGLALARSMVEMHGGTLTASSEGAGKGAEFVLTLPLSDKAAGDNEATGRRRSSPRRLAQL